MALIIEIDDVQLVYLGISSSGSGANLTLSFVADWLPLDAADAPIPMIGQLKDSESRLFSEYPQEVRDAIIVLNTYATSRIKAAKGI